ncbi:MAG: hypothetical protein ACKOF3_08215, partial [Spartobacteria bacterium]
SGAPPCALARRSGKSGQRPIEVLHVVGRGAPPTAPEGGRAPRDSAKRSHPKIQALVDFGITHEYPDMIEDMIEIPNNLNSVLADILSVYGN